VGVCVAGSEHNRAPVSADRLVQPLQLVEHIAQVEKRQDIVRIGLGRSAVKLLGPVKLAQVEVNRPQVDVGGRKAADKKRAWTPRGLTEAGPRSG
jgi:hypothetical protein